MNKIKDELRDTLIKFLKKYNKRAIELLITNTISNQKIIHTFITPDHIYNTIDDDNFILKWDKDVRYDIRFRKIYLPYDEIKLCETKQIKNGRYKILEIVKIILKNGMEFLFSVNCEDDNQMLI